MIGRSSSTALALPGWEPSKHTTAFTCVKVVPGDGEFSDAHCDKPSAEGEYSHQTIPKNTTTAIEAVGVGKSILVGHPAGLNVKITSENVHGAGWIENSEPSSEVHRITGHTTVEYTEPKLEGLTGCTVKGPIVVNAKFESVENPETGAMGIQFKATEEGKPFTEITIEGCIVKGTYPVEGTVVATGTGEGKSAGATLKFNPDSTHESLTAFGAAATFESEVTVKMAKEGEKEGHPISATTVTP